VAKGVRSTMAFSDFVLPSPSRCGSKEHNDYSLVVDVANKDTVKLYGKEWLLKTVNGHF
jgi:hypothetical protein